MAITFLKLFSPQFLSTTAATIYTVPASPTTSLLRNGRVQLTNISSAAVAATLHAVNSAGSPSTANDILPAVSIPPNQSISVDVPQLAAGDTLQGFAGTASAINISAIDGVLFS